MKPDYLLFCLVLFLSLVGLLLKDVAPSFQSIIAFLKYILLLLLFFRNIRKDFSSLIPFLFALFLVVFSISGGHYGIAGILVASMVPVSLCIFNQIKFSHRQIRAMQGVLLFSYFAYVLLSFCFRGILNPNQVGFTFLILFLDIFVCMFTNKGENKSNIQLYAVTVVTFLLILFTGSRTSLLVFIMMLFSFIFRKNVKRMTLILVAILVLFPLYPFVYCLLAGDAALRASQDTMLMNQDIFSGREIIWSYVFTELTDPSVFMFGGIDTEWWGKSMHNSAVDIIVRFGVPTLIFMFLMFIHYFMRINRLVNNKYKSLLLMVLAAMIWGTNESGLFLGYSFFLFFPFCIIHSKNVPEKANVLTTRNNDVD